MSPTFCDGFSRRDALRVGTASLFGSALGLPQLLRASDTAKAKKDVSLIFIFLHGGQSHIDTFDLKPDAPAEFRGDFSPAKTKIPGLQICDLLPKVAGQIDKFSLVRSFRHHNSDHGPADHYILTGYFPTAGFNPSLSPNNQRPCVGSVVSKKLGPKGSVPAYVVLPKVHPSGGAAYLGANHAPFVIDADPSAPNFSVPDLVPPPAIASNRLDDRKKLLETVDRFHKSAEVKANPAAGALTAFRDKAFDLMTSRQAKEAFNIHAEADKLRDEYGRHSLGQSCLMGRRLVEAGVRCVTIDHSNWDTHDGNFAVLKNSLLPMYDSAISTLFRDLSERGLLDSTMVVVTGEFGRTPRINKNAGRDHWGPAFTVLLGGGGIKPGVVVGKTDARAEKPASDPYGPEDLFATMYTCMGIDPKDEAHTSDGRPIALVNNGKVMSELV
ncbi:hypothetical protein : Uncharacterized protein OS=Singulisphaera acidiphila (strain ATCC BAA-1392 / DSM 18658 / VKM B-2454 / MOB10) GN=Sinac_3304 PE=4 SV=1: DUF1501 [Gemmata massiliana]|uniref:DUF1501 domain-containing protein n=1 Tax=Gemmata massiliana TaxID=1210884 RepID=A0A6P2DK12_9BACT|nr:DUF1501 domain-containing protein [Gemmata massiliana]VTS00845.1 hypothetical protein : Uncharacterized protein OS=Singulisphaera acidiphila (strain ATCC BAA-1392 / DSM 18658 / VKM B-2454 / MOB10) GN=Sinac_3304 PE=4 SV=1: DUF1501 [Gemmata massiliana]